MLLHIDPDDGSNNQRTDFSPDNTSAIGSADDSACNFRTDFITYCSTD
jgi:hypothetical protein